MARGVGLFTKPVLQKEGGGLNRAFTVLGGKRHHHKNVIKAKKPHYSISLAKTRIASHY